MESIDIVASLRGSHARDRDVREPDDRIRLGLWRRCPRDVADNGQFVGLGGELIPLDQRIIRDSRDRPGGDPLP